MERQVRCAAVVATANGGPILDELELMQRVSDTTAGYLALGCETFEAESARFVRNRDCPDLWDANHVSHVRCESDAQFERLLKRADAEFSHCQHRRFDLDPGTPPQLAARLAVEGYTPNETIELLLEGELDAQPRALDIRPIETDAEWGAYGELQEMDFRETTARQGREFNADVPARFLIVKRAKLPEVRYWLAYADDVPGAYFASWPGRNGVGIVEDLFTHPEYRHRGVATALIAHCVADARARGAGPVVIGADPTDTPKLMYAAMGFRPLFVARSYIRHLS